MNKLRFEWLVGLLLIMSLMTLSAVFCRFTLRVATEMPKESIQQLQKAISLAKHEKRLQKESALLVRMERFIVGVKKSVKRKKDHLKEEQEDKNILPAHTSNPYQTDPFSPDSEEKSE